VDKVIRRALSKKREDRFPDDHAFARAFEAAAAGAPAAGRRGQGGRRRQNEGTRPWLSLGVVARSRGGLDVREEIMSSQWWRAPRTRAHEPAPHNRRRRSTPPALEA
jgi:hypothetical protein